MFRHLTGGVVKKDNMKISTVRRRSRHYNAQKKRMNGCVLLHDEWIGANVVVIKRREYNALIVKIHQYERRFKKIGRLSECVASTKS